MKPSILKTFSTAVDYYTGRYQCFVATGREIDDCLAIRKRVFGDELKRGGGVGFSPALADEFDDKSLHIGCRDTKTGEIVGCVRMTQASLFAGEENYEKEYALELFESEMWERIVIPSRLAVIPEYRGAKIIGALLATQCYKEGMDQYWVSCMVCEPNLLSMYRRLGYRPLARVHTSPFGGYRLPLFNVTHDYENLERAGSPFWKVAKEAGFPAVYEGREWQMRFTMENGSVDPGFSSVDEEEAKTMESLLTREMSEEGKLALLKNAVKIQCRFGERVIARSDGGRNIAVVEKGAVEVIRDGKLKAILTEGDTFGEIAFLLGVPRTADVIAAAEETEILFLSLSAIERMERKEDQIHAWKNLATLLARKLSAPSLA